MLIEDDATYAWLVEEMLVEAFAGGHLEVAKFDSLGAATAETRVVDCALVDLSLPDSSGLGVIDTLLLALPAVPVVILTGAEDEELALQAVERGAQDYLVKRRVDPEVLGRSVRYAIERKRAELQRAELLRARAAHAEAEALSGMLARLQAVADAAIAVQGELDRQELLERSLSVIAAEAGALIEFGAGGGLAALAAVRGIEGVSRFTRLETTGVTDEVLSTDGPLVVNSVPGNDTSTFGPAHARSLVAVPLEADGRRLGVLVATSTLPDRFSEEQARLLALAADRCSRALANAAAYERERRTAAALQAGLLPQGVPQLRHGELAVRYLPALGGRRGAERLEQRLLTLREVGAALLDQPVRVEAERVAGNERERVLLEGRDR